METYKYELCSIIVLMEDLKILDDLFDSKILRILKLLLADKERKFYLRELSKEARVPVATTHRTVEKLVKLGIVDRVMISRFKLYKASENDKTAFIESFIKEEKQVIKGFVNEVSKLPGVESLILHGKEQHDRANILIIGENVDSNEVKRVCSEIKERYNFTISSLSLTMDQFRQMTKMGLYSGEKKVLWKK